MGVSGIMNAKPKFRLPGNIYFEDSKTIPISREKKEENNYSTNGVVDTVPPIRWKPHIDFYTT